MIRGIILGEIIGIPTARKLQKKIEKLKKEYPADFVMANADGASDGYGLLADTAQMVHRNGVDFITSGDCIFNKKDMKGFLSRVSYILRPYNLIRCNSGRGYGIYTLENGVSIGILNVLGRVNFSKIFPADPFTAVNSAIERIKEKTNIIIVDFHGGTTSEIQAMHWHLAGRASVVTGTHLRVLTSDQRIIANHTGVITGTGYCGAYYSINGLQPEIEIKKIKTGQFMYSKVNREHVVLQGVYVEIDEETGKTENITLINEKIDPDPQ